MPGGDNGGGTMRFERGRMMAGTKKKSTNEILVRILEELAANTDAEHGLSTKELSRRLGVTEKTVRGHLQMLESQRPFGRAVGQLTPEMIEHADSDDAAPGWYMEPAIDLAQLRLLGDGLALSRIDEEYAREAYDRLRSLAGYAGIHSKGLRNLRIPRQYNREFLSNVENLDEAIGGGRVVRFHMCRYDVDGTLTERIDAGSGKPREYLADPYQMTYRNGMYYLLCHMHGRPGIGFVHVDRIRHLAVLGQDIAQECRLEDLRTSDGTPLSLSDFLTERLYPWTGEAEDVRLRVSDLACVYDWFGRPQVRRIDERIYEVRARVDPRTVLWWALQYADAGIIEVLEPASLRRMMADVGETLTAMYGTPDAATDSDAATEPDVGAASVEWSDTCEEKGR